MNILSLIVAPPMEPESAGVGVQPLPESFGFRAAMVQAAVATVAGTPHVPHEPSGVDGFGASRPAGAGASESAVFSAADTGEAAFEGRLRPASTAHTVADARATHVPPPTEIVERPVGSDGGGELISDPPLGDAVHPTRGVNPAPAVGSVVPRVSESVDPYHGPPDGPDQPAALGSRALGPILGRAEPPTGLAEPRRSAPPTELGVMSTRPDAEMVSAERAAGDTWAPGWRSRPVAARPAPSEPGLEMVPSSTDRASVPTRAPSDGEAKAATSDPAGPALRLRPHAGRVEMVAEVPAQAAAGPTLSVPLAVRRAFGPEAPKSVRDSVEEPVRTGRSRGSVVSDAVVRESISADRAAHVMGSAATVLAHGRMHTHEARPTGLAPPGHRVSTPPIDSSLADGLSEGRPGRMADPLAPSRPDSAALRQSVPSPHTLGSDTTEQRTAPVHSLADELVVGRGTGTPTSRPPRPLAFGAVWTDLPGVRPPTEPAGRTERPAGATDGYANRPADGRGLVDLVFAAERSAAEGTGAVAPASFGVARRQTRTDQVAERASQTGAAPTVGAESGGTDRAVPAAVLALPTATAVVPGAAGPIAGSADIQRIDPVVIEPGPPVRTASVAIVGPDGHVIRVQVTVRGEQVATRIVHPDREVARTLVARGDELRQALAERGFESSLTALAGASSAPRGGGAERGAGETSGRSDRSDGSEPEARSDDASRRSRDDGPFGRQRRGRQNDERWLQT